MQRRTRRGCLGTIDEVEEDNKALALPISGEAVSRASLPPADKAFAREAVEYDDFISKPSLCFAGNQSGKVSEQESKQLQVSDLITMLTFS